MEHNFEYRQRMRQERVALRRKAALRKRVRTLTTVLTVAFIFISVISANAVIANAGNGYNKVLKKMYTSVVVEHNDTVWDIASEYAVPDCNTVSELVEEIAYINDLDDSFTIKSGMMLMVPYYAEG